MFLFDCGLGKLPVAFHSVFNTPSSRSLKQMFSTGKAEVTKVFILFKDALIGLHLFIKKWHLAGFL